MTVKVVSRLPPDFRTFENSHKMALLVLLAGGSWASKASASSARPRVTGSWGSAVGRGYWHLRTSVFPSP